MKLTKILVKIRCSGYLWIAKIGKNRNIFEFYLYLVIRIGNLINLMYLLIKLMKHPHIYILQVNVDTYGDNHTRLYTIWGVCISFPSLCPLCVYYYYIGI